jgi:hypothetical protein
MDFQEPGEESRGAERETVIGVVFDNAAAEETVARLVRLADINAGGHIEVVVEALEDDPATPRVEGGVSLRAEVPADKAAAARAALAEAGKKGNGGEGGI